MKKTSAQEKKELDKIAATQRVPEALQIVTVK